MADTRERLIRYLDEAWAVEKALVSNLEKMANDETDPQIRSMLQEHRLVTHQQEENLEARIRALGEEPSGSKGWFKQMFGAIGDMLQNPSDDLDRTQQHLMKGFAIENMECAMYESLAAYATAIGDTATAQLARQHQQQEKQAADLIWARVAPSASSAAMSANTTVRAENSSAFADEDDEEMVAPAGRSTSRY